MRAWTISLLATLAACGGTDTNFREGDDNTDVVAGDGGMQIDPAAVVIEDVDYAAGLSKSGQFTVTSVGENNLVLYELKIVADETDSFYFPEEEDITLAPGESRAFTVVATLTVDQIVTGELQVRSNDPDNVALILPLTACPVGTPCETDTGGGDTGSGDTGSGDTGADTGSGDTGADSGADTGSGDTGADTGADTADTADSGA